MAKPDYRKASSEVPSQQVLPQQPKSQLPVLESFGIGRADGDWCVFRIRTQGEIILSREILRQKLDKPTALAVMADEVAFAKWGQA